MKTAVKRYFESRGSAVDIEKRGDVLPEYVDCLVIEDSKHYGVECDYDLDSILEFLGQVTSFLKGKKEVFSNEVDSRMVG